MSRSGQHRALVSGASSRWAARRFRAAKALRDEDPDFALPLLERLLTRGPSTRVISAAAASLHAIDDPRARDVLVKALDHPNDWVRLLAAERLAEDRDSRARPVLLAAFETDDIDQFGPAVQGICKYADAEARQALERAAGDPKAIPLLREIASNGLHELGTHESLPALRLASNSENSSVRWSAREAIKAVELRETKSVGED